MPRFKLTFRTYLFTSLDCPMANIRLAILLLVALATGSHRVVAQQAPLDSQQSDSATDDMSPIVAVERQPLAANILRVLETLDYLGHAFPGITTDQLRASAMDADSVALQEMLDKHALFYVSINPELRVKVQRGAAPARLQQGGFTPCLIKVENAATIARRLRIDSPQAGPSYAGASLNILQRQDQTELADNENSRREHRFLSTEIFDKAPMTPKLSGLAVEYLVALIYSSEAGRREATIVFDVGQGTQDVGFRSELPVLFDIEPAVAVKLHIADFDGNPTAAKLVVRDQDGRIYPPQAKRLAPDLFFQPQVYRHSGGMIHLPPGEFTLTSSRGPEYIKHSQKLVVKEGVDNEVAIQLERWINPMQFGYFCGDHHIHGAGCSHYDNPTLGVTPVDMFAQVKGEGLNVGCVLTWGPCFEHQRNFFSPIADTTSEPKTLIKYDLEISGFGSAALGHVCLLNLQTQTYPGSEGSKEKGWPSWTVPVMRWAKEQGGVTGYPHSALHVNPRSAATWLMQYQDDNKNSELDHQEAMGTLLPTDFATIDRDRSNSLSHKELEQANDIAADQLPNFALPAMDGGGAMEIFVSTAEGVCDFVSAMDTARIPEWNTWYHLMNCGFPLKLSGETDFPCMSSRRVGQGRVYVNLGETQQIDFTKWCEYLGTGRSYVSDGFAHALNFEVDGQHPGGGDVELSQSGQVQVSAQVAFAKVQPRAVAYGTYSPRAGRRMHGDTINLHAPRDTGQTDGGSRRIEVVVNGSVVQSTEVAADGQIHDLQFLIPIEQSSWVAIRQFPQLHSNPVTVKVAGQPVRASRKSAVWCIESIRRLWVNRSRFIHESERDEARQAYHRAMAVFAQRAQESPTDGTTITPPQLPSTNER